MKRISEERLQQIWRAHHWAVRRQLRAWDLMITRKEALVLS